MDDVFGRVGGRFKTSIADSTMMWILQCAMNKAHERVHSKQGVIARLNEMSKFYELAVMQLEGCLKFVQEEAESSLESSDEETLWDLAEIRDRLQGRLGELELAISEKDRELEDESKLRQAVEHTEREMDSLRANLEIERTKGEEVEDDILGNRLNVDEDTEEFSELKNSVDQQVWKIKRKLDPDKRLVYRRRKSFDNTKIEQMSSDIDILKETMDLAFGRMHSAIELELKDQIFKWTVEKDAMAILTKSFIRDTRDNFISEVTRREKQVSVSLSKHLSDLMKEIKCLHEELDSSGTFQGNLEGKPGNNMRRSSSLGGSFRLPDDFASCIEKTDQTNLLSKENPEDDGGPRVARLVKGHESIIQRKNMELSRQKPELPREKGFSQLRTGQDPVSPLRRIRDVIVRLEKLINWTEELGETFGCYEGEESKETSATERFCTPDTSTDLAQSQVDTLDVVWKTLNRNSPSHLASEELRCEIRTLKEEKEDADFQALMLEDIYSTLLEGLLHESFRELNAHDLEILVKDAMHEHAMKDMADRWNEKINSDVIERQTREEICYFVFGEALKELSSTLYSASIKDSDAREKINCLEEDMFERKLREEICRVSFTEMLKCWYESIERYEVESLVKEEIHSVAIKETIKDVINSVDEAESKYKEFKRLCNGDSDIPTANASFQPVETSLQEELCKVILRETFAEWKEEMHSHNMECLIRQEIHLLIIVEAANASIRSYRASEARDQLRNSKDFIPALKLHTGMEFGGSGNSLIQNEQSIRRGTKFEGFIQFETSDMMERNAQSDKEPKLEELDKPEIFQKLLTDIGSSSISVSSKVGEALVQLAVSKALLRELRCRLGIVDHQITPTEPEQEMKPSLLRPPQGKQNLIIAISESSLTTIMELSQAFVNFERRVEEKLGRHISRLEEAMHCFHPLAEAVALQKRKKRLYKEAFLKRCESLRMAEREVDLLGDQVDALQDILETVFQTLHYHSPVLQQHFEVSEMLETIMKALNKEAIASGN